MDLKLEVTKMHYWFKDYAQKYQNDIDSENIELKLHHSLRVAADIVEIARKLHLSEDEISLAETMGLLHDIARFEQYKKFQTFRDADSFNHAEEGYKIIKQNFLLENYSEKHQEYILKAIRYHNRLHLPESEKEDVLFFCRLLRDADKLDILRVVSEYYARPHALRNKTIELGLKDTPDVTEKILTAVLNRKDVNYEDIRCLNDFKLLQAGWVFALNFVPTLNLVKQRGYLQIIRKNLPDDEKIDLVFKHIYNYISNKENENETRTS